MKKLEDKVAVITGATSGIGLDTAKLFLAEGAKVVLTGRSQEKLDALENALEGEFLLVEANAASIEDSKRLISESVNRFGRIDILFLNAGIFQAHPIGMLSEQAFDEIFNINVKGPLFTVNEAVQYMNDGGSILFNVSVSNVQGTPGVSVYGSSKAALRSIVRTLAAELAERNIRVNAISPGPIDTPIWGKTNLNEEQIKEFATRISKKIPLGRFGKGVEIARTALFLACGDSSFITGSEIPVDGGLVQV